MSSTEQLAFGGWFNDACEIGRAVEPDPDLAYTPISVAWAGIHLLEADLVDGTTCWDPHAGAGAWVHALHHFARHHRRHLMLVGSDIDSQAPALRQGQPWLGQRWDALSGEPPGMEGRVDWVIGNPPFSTFDDQLRIALKVARRGVCFLSLGQCYAPKVRDYIWSGAQLDSMHWFRERIAFQGPGRDGRKTDMREYAMGIWRRNEDGGWMGESRMGRLSWKRRLIWVAGRREPVTFPPMPAPAALGGA